MSRARVTNHWGEWFNSSDWEWRHLVEFEKDPTDPLAWDTFWPERAPHRVVDEPPEQRLQIRVRQLEAVLREIQEVAASRCGNMTWIHAACREALRVEET